MSALDRSIKVTLGGREIEVQKLGLRASAKWCAKYETIVSRIIAKIQEQSDNADGVFNVNTLMSVIGGLDGLVDAVNEYCAIDGETAIELDAAATWNEYLAAIMVIIPTISGFSSAAEEQI